MLALRNAKRFTGSQGGFTLVEVTIILVVLVILSMIMLPQLGNFNRLAKKVVVFEEVGALCASIKKMLDEVMLNGFYDEPGGAGGTPMDPIGLLVGPGNLPTIGAGATTPPNVTAGNWDIDPCPSDDTLSVTPDNGMAGAVAFNCDRFENNLQINDPQADGTTITDRYKNQIDSPEVGAFSGWRGPYFNAFNSDPFGTRYSANVFGLHTDTNGDFYSTAVICISFGPNKVAETQINMPHPDGYLIGGDDIVAVLSAMGPF